MIFNYEHGLYNTEAANQIIPILLQNFSINSVMDVGCGLGTWLQVFSERGINNLLGIDGGHVKNEFLLRDDQFIEWNLNNTFELSRNFDLIICLELAEHLEERSADKLVASLVGHSDLILFSAAIPFQGGQDHINEQWVGYWASKFKKHGYHFFDGIRDMVWDNPQVNWWYKQNIFIVSKNNLSDPFWKSERQLIHPYCFERNSRELHNIQTGNIGYRYLFSLIYKFVKRKFQKLI